MTNTKAKGFTLVELLIAMAIMAILVGIAIPSFLGLQERARKKTMVANCRANTSEIQAWLTAAYNREPVDGDGDGVADECIIDGGTFSTCPPSNPPSNPALGVTIAYTNYQTTVKRSTSPWSASTPLFVAKTTCDDTPEKGRITLCPLTNLSIKLMGYDKDGEILCVTTILGGD